MKTLAALLVAGLLGGCLDAPNDPPAVQAAVFDLTMTACDSANIHVYHPINDLRALVPDMFTVVPYQSDLTGVLVVNVVECAEASAIEVTVLIAPPELPAIVTEYDAGSRVPHDEAGLPLDQYLVAAFTSDGHLAAAYDAAGVYAGAMDATVDARDVSLGAAVLVQATDAAGQALAYESAAPTSRYGDVTHRFWHLDDEALSVFEHFLPDPAYAFPGEMTCIVRPESALAETMMRPACHPVMSSAVYGFEWWGNAYVFDRASIGL